MISDFKTNFIYFSRLLETDVRYIDINNSIAKILRENQISFDYLDETNDIWARDYMPIQLSDNEFIEYRYDPDYLQKPIKGYRNTKSYPDLVCDSINLETRKSNIIIDGGNVVKNDNSVIMTDKVIYENRFQFNKTQLIKKLHETFQVESVVIIPRDEKDIYGHADGMVRFINSNTLLVNSVYRNDKSLISALKQSHFNCEFLQYKVSKQSSRNWCFINFLQTENIILVPKLNIEEDEQAFDKIKSCYTEYSRNNRLFQIVMPKIVERGGALNCVSWTIRKN